MSHTKNISYLIKITWVFAIFILPPTAPLQAQNLCSDLFLPATTQNFTGDDVIRQPITNRRLGGISTLRKIIRWRGLTTVFSGTTEEYFRQMKKFEYLHGTALAFTDSPIGQLSNQPLPGVVLHPGPPSFFNTVRGEINPHLGVGNLVTDLQSKVFEAKVLKKLDPRSPKVRFLEEQPIPIEESLQLTAGQTPTQKDLLRVKRFFKTVFAELQNEFPNKAIIKHAFEYKTGDSKIGPVILGKTSPDELANHFIEKFAAYTRGQKVGAEDLPKKIFTKKWDPHWAIAYSLIFAQKDLFVQGFEKIRSEWRLDTIDGKVLHAQPRFGDWKLSPDQLIATQYLESILKTAGYPFNRLAGGFDVAVRENGKPFLIETNAGGESFFIDGYFAPISANLYVSALTGVDTQLVSDLKLIANSGRDQQVFWIKNFIKKYLDHLQTSDAKDAESEIYEFIRLHRLQEISEDRGRLPNSLEIRVISDYINELQSLVHRP